MEQPEYENNPILKKNVETDNGLKKILVEYTGKKINPKDSEVNVEMIIEVMAAEFPEFLLALAEENWIRGYQQALDDVEMGKSVLDPLLEQNDK